MLKKPIFLAGNADWLSELPTVTKQYKNTIHSSTKKTPIQASKKSNERKDFSILKDRKENRQPKFKLGQIVRTADIRRDFSKGDSTNYSYNLYTRTKIVHDSVPSYRIDYLPERYNEKLLLPTKLSLEENNEVMKNMNLIQ